MTKATPENQPLSANWSEQKAKLKEQFPVLTDSDLKYEPGQKEVLLNRLQSALGKTRDELQALLASI